MRGFQQRVQGLQPKVPVRSGGQLVGSTPDRKEHRGDEDRIDTDAGGLGATQSFGKEEQTPADRTQIALVEEDPDSDVEAGETLTEQAADDPASPGVPDASTSSKKDFSSHQKIALKRAAYWDVCFSP